MKDTKKSPNQREQLTPQVREEYEVPLELIKSMSLGYSGSPKMASSNRIVTSLNPQALLDFDKGKGEENIEPVSLERKEVSLREDKSIPIEGSFENQNPKLTIQQQLQLEMQQRKDEIARIKEKKE